jgi:hypothetical protein
MPTMPEQQAPPIRSVRRAALVGTILAGALLAAACAPDAPPIQRASRPPVTAADGASPAAPAAATGATGAATDASPLARGGRRPDVLLISLDTLRADALGCYGNTRPTSPTIDGLAERGVRFARCYAPAPHTAPSHVSLLSGLLPLAHGVPNASAESQRLAQLNENWPTLTELLAGDGYQTMFVCNGGQLRREMGIERAVEQFDSSTRTFAAAIEVVDSMLGDVAPDEPLFSFVHTYETHAPYLPPRRMNGAPLHGRFTDREYRGVLRRTYDKLIGRIDEGAGLAAEFLAGSEAFTAPDIEFLVGLYHEEVLWTDSQLLRLLEVWSSRRDISNTVVVIVSDHGEQLGERGAFGHRFGLDVELVHVPLIAFGPGIEPRVEDGVVSLASVAAAILEHVDAAVPEHLQRGARLARGSAPSAVAHLQDASGKNASVGVVDGALQYLRGMSGNRSPRETVLDLALDPRGSVAVKASAADLERLRVLVGERIRIDQGMRTRYPVVLDDVPTRGQKELLRDLGYSEEGPADEPPPDESNSGRGGDRER